jgi:hypothetical protein
MAEESRESKKAAGEDANLSRRAALIKLAGAGLGVLVAGIARPSLASLPESAVQLSCAIGTWPGADTLPSIGALRPGWGDACAAMPASPCSPEPADSLRFAGRAARESLACRVRVLGFDGALAHGQLAFDALHHFDDGTVARHALFTATPAPGRMASATRIRMQAVAGMLPFELTAIEADGTRAVEAVQVPAVRGVYLVAVAGPRERLPVWHRWAFMATAQDPAQRRMVQRDGGTAASDFGYLLLTVDPIA